MFEADPLQALGQRILALVPEIIGVSVRNINDQNVQNPRFLIEQVRPVIDKCKALSDALIVLGGTGYSIFPDEIFSYLGADYGISGDGELVFPSLLERMRNRENISGLPGVHVTGRKNAADQEFSSDPDALPLPSVEQWSYVDPDSQNLWAPGPENRVAMHSLSA